MFPLSFATFNIIYWLSYNQGGVIFDWADHRLSGKLA